MTAEHQMLMEGVSNFREFQRRGSRFFDQAEAVWKADKSRRARNLAIAAILAVPLTGLMGWLSIQIVDNVQNILRIEEQWKQAHPSEFVKPQSLFHAPDPNPAYALEKRSAQDAKGW